jgi:chemosensory pili system protein ChpA (sensor histidine kinase/response regulator)
MSEQNLWANEDPVVGEFAAQATSNAPQATPGGDLLASFAAEAKSYLPKLEQALAGFAHNPQRIDLLAEAHNHVQVIQGAANVVGLMRLSATAAKLDELLETLAANQASPTEALTDTFKQMLAALQLCLDQVISAETDLLLSESFEPTQCTVAEISDDFIAYQQPVCGESLAADLNAPPCSATAEAEAEAEAEIPPELLEVFVPEAEEHLRAITVTLPLLAATPENQALLLEVRRNAHSLKGSAAVVGFHKLAKLAHRMEDMLDLLYEGERQLTPALLHLLFASTEMLESLLNRQASPETLAALYQAYDQWLVGDAPPAVNTQALSAEVLPDAPPTGPLVLPATASAETNVETAPARPTLPPRAQSVRVPIERLDELVKLVAELIVTRATFEQHMTGLLRQLEELHGNTARLNRVATRMEVQFEASTLGGERLPQRVFAGAQAQNFVNSTTAMLPLLTTQTYGFDELEFDRYTEFHLLLRELTESASDFQALERELTTVKEYFENCLNRQGRLCSDIQERLMRLRMVPLSTLAARLHRTAHTVAAQQQKQVTFELEGEETRLDKTIIESLADPLLHLLRNAIDHGIELPAARQAQGKPLNATVRLRAYHEGTQTVIQLSDDGAGLDPERLRQAAIRMGHLSQSDAQTLGAEDLNELIFLPGFSTAAEVSEISGRGIGLDVVKTTLHRLKGSLRVESRPGAGTVFTLRLPMTLAVIRALLVKSCDQIFAIPLAGLQQVVKLTPNMLDYLGQNQVIRSGGKVYPLLQLKELLNLKSAPGAYSKQMALLMNIEERPVAIVVDETLGGREIVVKDLGKHLRHVRGVTGATLLGDGSVVLILNLAELLHLALHPRPQAEVPKAVARTSTPMQNLPRTQTAATPLTVLVVDDSLSVRRVLSNRIVGLGWRAMLAKDGIDALEQLQNAPTPPDIMLVDIEMPRMDGYEFTSTLRKQPDYAHIPIVVLTSRAGQKHRDRAFEVGATEYLVKPYQDEVLISLIRRLTARPVRETAQQL